MENVITISRPYAKAVYSIAKESENPQKAIKFWELVLYTAKEAILSEKGQLILAASNENQGPCNKFVQAVLGEDLCIPEVVNFLNTIEHFARFAYLPGIFDHFEQIREEDNELPTPVELIFARQLTNKDELAKIGKVIAEKLNRCVSLTVSVDPTLLSGLVIKTDNFTIDCSGRKTLEDIKNALCS